MDEHNANWPVIDVHTHVWPDGVAARAVATITEFAVRGNGTTSGLMRAQDEAGVDLSVCLSFALLPDHVGSVNRYAGQLDRSRFLPFGTIHPDLSPEENVCHLRESRMSGVKLHPTFQKYRLDDPKVMAILEALAGEFPVVTHAGGGAGGDGSQASPLMLRRITRALPNLTLIAAHFGAYRMLEQALEEIAGESIFIDTSWPPSLANLDARLVREMIYRHGVEKVLFGSDWPTAHPADEVSAVHALGLSEEETRLVLGGNALRVLGIPNPMKINHNSAPCE